MNNKEYIVEIKKYSKKGMGQGVAAELSKDIEVRGAHLGEQILAQVFKKKQGVHEARIIELVRSHPCRIEPRCRHSGVCGGCSWQELSYEQQGLYKQQKIEELFQAVSDTAYVYPIITMKDPWAFRNKMEFSFYQDRDKNRSLGLVMGGTKGRVIDLQECHLVRPWMMEVLEATRTWWESTTVEAYHRFKNEGTLHTLTLREGMRTGEKLVMLTVSGEPCSAFSHKELEAFKQAIMRVVPSSLTLFLQIKHVKAGMATQYNEMLLHGPDHIKERLTVTYPGGTKKEFVFKISPSSFFQPNTEQAEKLFSRALAMVEQKPRKYIVDLYCGTATLGMVFSPLAKQVFGVELNPYAVFDAEVNQEVNGISNMEIIQGDVKDAQLGRDPIDLLIVDPPRAGLGAKIVDKIVSLQPAEVLYISCNPYTQAEDVKQFLNTGYKLVSLQPVDQFPHSAHLENIAVLRRLNAITASI